MSQVAAEPFFEDLTRRALASAKGAPALRRISLVVGKGWRLGFEPSTAPGEIVLVNATLSRVGKLDFSYIPAKGGSEVRRQRLDRVGRLLCKALTQAPVEGRLPTVVQERLRFWLPGDCDRACIFCSVSIQRVAAPHPEPEPVPEGRGGLPILLPDVSAVTWPELEAALRDNAHRAAEVRVEWSGKDCTLSPLFDRGLDLAYELGYRMMGVQTPGSRLADGAFVDTLRERSVTWVALTAHAADEATFDAVGGKVGAYRAFRDGLAHVQRAGMQVVLSVPCIAQTVDGLADHVAQLATHGTELTVFFWYPSDDMLDQFGDLGMSFERATEALAGVAERVTAQRVTVDGIPACMVPPGLEDHFRWVYGGRHMTFLDFTRLPECETCPRRAECPGIVPVYGRFHQPRVVARPT